MLNQSRTARHMYAEHSQNINAFIFVVTALKWHARRGMYTRYKEKVSNLNKHVSNFVPVGYTMLQSSFNLAAYELPCRPAEMHSHAPRVH